MVTTIQQTAKRWKALRIAAYLMAAIGAAAVLFAFWPLRGRADALPMLFGGWPVWLGIGLLAAAVLLDAYARVMAWWHHA